MAAAVNLQAFASSPTSGAGNYGLPLDNPAASGVQRFTALQLTPIAQREDNEAIGGGRVFCDQTGNFSAQQSLFWSPRTHPQQLPHGYLQQSLDPTLTAFSDTFQAQSPPR